MAADRRTAERRERRTRLRTAMESSPLENVPQLSLARNWVFAKSLGGGMAVASLWVELDSEKVVRDRVVRKDTQMDEEGWRGNHNWHVDANHPDWREPLEHYCHGLVQGHPNAPNRTIVQARKCELDDANRVYRLYTDYCPYGDLNDLISNNNMQMVKIPEAWMWMAFAALVDAGLAMEKGKNPAVQVVHRDLKPANVFLDLPSEESWPRYPSARVGDFGLAVVTAPVDGDNPWRWGLSGTPNYYAPEQRLLDRRLVRPTKLTQLLAWTNVWGIGRIMLDIVNQTPHSTVRNPIYNTTGHCDGSSFKADVRAYYSGVLLKTIMACLTIPATRRPTFASLRNHLDVVMLSPSEHTDGWSKELKEYMHNAHNGVQKEDARHDLRGLPDEQYRFDMAFQNLRSARSGAATSAVAGGSNR